uniref:DNA polymerase I n=1 Tax=Nannochloropsis gaditana (strain CCMP526) TaxID=1093141 RepID=I2CP17_NANGC
MCATRGLIADGSVEELRDRYKDDVLFTAELRARRLALQGRLPPSPNPPSSPSSPPLAPAAMEERNLAPEETQKKARKYINLTIHGLGLTPETFTAAGAPAVSAAVLRKLAGNPSEGVWGSAYKHFNEGKEGEEACVALDALCAMGSIDTMLSNFLLPLQDLADDDSRVHCSLNLNTETGRLSARRPNLQNQPALEKDQYKIRKAFVSEPNQSLIVADYGQLELRLLAHITKCQSMIQAFKEGGCFHSRTAVGMFEHVRKAVESGEVLLEWDYAKGKPPAPLLKDKFGSERRKAKTLNFSIAYGKTAFGLSKDWGVSTKEAEAMLEAWYADRPEVKEWQEKAIAEAHRTSRTKTLMGRYRKLPEINSRTLRFQRHAERAAINTPIQGGAADVVMMAMLRIHNSQVLARLGWKLLLQIHDEVIVEGPDESREEALAEVKRCMEHPGDGYGLGELLVKLEVDAKIAKSWYEAK